MLPNTMSLATLRAHVWKGGNDIVLFYKGNGRKEIPFPPRPVPEEAAGQAEGGTAVGSTGQGQGQVVATAA